MSISSEAFPSAPASTGPTSNTTELSLAAELRSSALLFAMAIGTTALVVALAQLTVRLLG